MSCPYKVPLTQYDKQANGKIYEQKDLIMFHKGIPKGDASYENWNIFHCIKNVHHGL